jgi:hypothetical protein
MNGSASSRVARENQALHERLSGFASARVSGEVCAIEAAGVEDSERAERRALVGDALSNGARPIELGLSFVVAMAECAYEVDWQDQFSFWPEISKILVSSEWDPRDLELREQCTSAFQSFAKKYGGLQPQGRFADRYTHVSWPLFHAILPRAAQARMSKLLARATADERFVVAADGCVDQRDLTTLLREFAMRSAMPEYFEGILQHPTLGGRLGASLLSASRARPKRVNGDEAASGLSDEFIARLLRDLREDRVAREQLDEATEEVVRKEERAMRRQRAVDATLEPPRSTLLLERAGAGLRMFVEFAPFDAPALEWRPLAALISTGDARAQISIGDAVVPAGYVVNLAYGAIAVEASWPPGQGALEISLKVLSAGGRPVDEQVASYFSRSRRELRLPLVFQCQPDRRRFLLGPSELRPGADIAIAAPSRTVQTLAPLLSALGLELVPLERAPDVEVLIGGVPGSPSPEFVELVKRLGLRHGKELAEIRPALVPPLRSDADTIEWIEGEDGFVQIAVGGPSTDLRLGLEAGGESQSIPIDGVAGEHLLSRVPGSACGSLVLRRREAELARVQLIRRPRATYREAPARFRAIVMPTRPTRAHLLAEACWLDVAALPGVNLKVALSTDQVSEEEFLPADMATPLRTALLIASMRRRIEHSLGPQAVLCDYELRVSNADEPTLPALVQKFPAVSGAIGFDVSEDRAQVRLDANADPALLSKLRFEPGGVHESALPAIVQVVEPGAPEGIYVARTRGAVAALAWAADLGDLPRVGALDLPTRGAERSLSVVELLRACEAASLGPAARVGRALLVRRAAVRSLERELIASLCGRRWLERESCDMARPNDDRLVDNLLAKLSSMLWVPRVWLRQELPRLVDEADDPVQALERACQKGIGEALRAIDVHHARHLLLLFTRAAMATPDDDAECMRWANADVMRPRLVRLFFLAAPRGLARQAEHQDTAFIRGGGT